jgi:hypothetical protein
VNLVKSVLHVIIEYFVEMIILNYLVAPVLVACVKRARAQYLAMNM